MVRQDVLVARDEWFRSPAWDEQIEAAFEERLRRARPYNQPQYIRIQATHLLSSPDPRVREAGRGLLRRVITTFPDGSEARTAMEQLGGSLADEGRLGEAEQALRETLRMCAQSPAGRSGTSGIAELRLAEVILAGDDAGRAGGGRQLARGDPAAGPDAAVPPRRGLPVPARLGPGRPAPARSGRA